MREMQSHITVRCMLLSKKTIRSTQIGMVNLIEGVAGVDVRVAGEAVEMEEVVDMPIIKMFNLPHGCNLPRKLNPLHSSLTICGTIKHHRQCLPLHTMTLYSQEIPSTGLAMSLPPSRYLT